jgi:NADPH:quinone reductase-like Zn-dependent oxidoreductase
LVNLPDPQPRSGWAIVRVHAAAVNPSDVKNVAGQMEGTLLPRIPGRDFSGLVEAGPPDWVGTEVWGTGGDAGFALDGSHAELIAVPESALSRRPAALNFAQAASVGVPFVVGWMGLADYAGLQRGEDVAIVGVSGGVGGAVAQLARAIGARRVLGIDRRPPAGGSPAASRIDAYIAADGDVAAAVKAQTGGHGAHVVFDAVGGVMFETALGCLAPKGRLIEIAATGRRRVEFDLLDFFHNESRLFGADSRKLGLVESAAILNQLAPLFDQGSLEATLVHSALPLERGIEAYQTVAAGAAARIVIKP